MQVEEDVTKTVALLRAFFCKFLLMCYVYLFIVLFVFLFFLKEIRVWS